MKCVCPFFATRAQQWVPCGKCNFCLRRKRSEWSFRLYQELKSASTASFLTLSYNPESAVSDIGSQKLTLEKSHFQNFMKRVRKKSKAKGLRYYAVGEYGELYERPHIHVLLFNLPSDTLGDITDIWGKGSVDRGEVEPASIAYVSGYVINRDKNYGTRQKPWACISKSNGGLGSAYLTPQMRRWHKSGKTAEFKNYAMFEGYKVPLHRLYKDRLFSKHDKSVMGITMSEQQDSRWITEIERLSSLHSDPLSYYELKAQQAYDRVRTVKNKKVRVF